jgi:hypothetical protein
MGEITKTRHNLERRGCLSSAGGKHIGIAKSGASLCLPQYHVGIVRRNRILRRKIAWPIHLPRAEIMELTIAQSLLAVLGKSIPYRISDQA